MTAPYNVSEVAERDLLDIASYIALDSLRNAERFLAHASETFQTLADMPGIGTACQFPHSPLKDIRRWPVKRFESYLVFYRPADGEAAIEVIRVVHGARDLPELFGDPED